MERVANEFIDRGEGWSHILESRDKNMGIARLIKKAKLARVQLNKFSNRNNFLEAV
jgi:hypothetical protein